MSLSSATFPPRMVLAVLISVSSKAIHRRQRFGACPPPFYEFSSNESHYSSGPNMAYDL